MCEVREAWRGREGWGKGVGRRREANQSTVGRKGRWVPRKAHRKKAAFFLSMLHNFHSLHLWKSLNRFTTTTKPMSSLLFSLIRYYSLLFLMVITHLWLFNLSFVLAFYFLLRCTESYLQYNICDDLPNVWKEEAYGMQVLWCTGTEPLSPIR